MSERSKDGADPDATVMIPAPKADEDATVMMAPASPDNDATVMIPAPGPDAAVTTAAAAVEPDAEATIAIPTPGRKRESEVPALPATPAAGSVAVPAQIGELGGINPLVAAANPVLAAAAQIRRTLRHPDPEGLRASLRQGVDAFEAGARAAGAGDAALAAARFALEALVNESAASTPWGAAWATDEGGQFFQSLEQHAADPAANRDLLEFFYVCLALGYEGRYRQQTDGRQALVEIRARLLGQLRALRPPCDGELSGRWRGVQAPERRPKGTIGFWLAGSAAALLLAALYVGYSVSLGSLSDPVARDLARLKAAAEPPQARPAAAPDVASQLAAEIARGEVAVTDAAGMSTIVIRSDRLFASGSARLEADIEPVVRRFAAALERVPGTVLVTGHTDDVPIRTARFPSNWELSTERAASVVKLMAGNLKDAARLRAEGLADSAPLAANDSAANRARNRRVEIILRSGP